MVLFSFANSAPVLTLAFFGLRSFGMSALGLVSSVIQSKWWVTKNGRVSSLSGIVGAILSTSVFSIVYEISVQSFGWRSAYRLFSLVTGCILAPLCLIFIRSTPESVGLLPDGQSSPKVASPQSAAKTLEGWDTKDAIRTPMFWAFSIGNFFWTLVAAGEFFNVVPTLNQKGFPLKSSPPLSSLLYTPLGIASAASTVVSGFAIDRFRPPRVIAVGFLIQAAGGYLGLSLSSVPAVLAFGIVNGLSNGWCGTCYRVAYATMFGRRNNGAITSIGRVLLVAGTAVGPLLFGIAPSMATSMWGGDVMSLAASSLMLLCSLVLVFMGEPKKPDRARDSDVAASPAEIEMATT
jgi:sugar phosphate permease